MRINIQKKYRQIFRFFLTEKFKSIALKDQVDHNGWKLIYDINGSRRSIELFAKKDEPDVLKRIVSEHEEPYTTITYLIRDDANLERINYELFFSYTTRNNESGPSELIYQNGRLISESYYINNKLHREGGPAVINYDEDGNLLSEYYYINDELHRSWRPAVIKYYPNGAIKQESYYTNGILGSEVYYNEDGSERL